MQKIYIGFSLIFLAGCSTLIDSVNKSVSPIDATPSSVAEQIAGFRYVPLDPLSVEQSFSSESCDFINSLPDSSVRVAIRSRDGKGDVSFGASAIGTKGNRYQVVLDYIITDTIPVQIRIYRNRKKVDKSGKEIFGVYSSREESSFEGKKRIYTEYFDSLTQVGEEKEIDVLDSGTEITRNSRAIGINQADRIISRGTFKPHPDQIFSHPLRFETSAQKLERVIQDKEDFWEYHSSPDENIVTFPVYVGVGMRMTADVTVNRGTVNLASLGAIGAAAEANEVTGTLVVQTLGLNGKQVSANLPLPSALNQTTIENAIQSLGAIKAIAFNNDIEDVQTRPRIVGIYIPVNDGSEAFINAVVSELASEPELIWEVEC